MKEWAGARQCGPNATFHCAGACHPHLLFPIVPILPPSNFDEHQSDKYLQIYYRLSFTSLSSTSVLCGC